MNEKIGNFHWAVNHDAKISYNVLVGRYLQDLNRAGLKLIDNRKCAFYNKVLGLPKITRTRLVVFITGTTLATKKFSAIFGVSKLFGNYLKFTKKRM